MTTPKKEAASPRLWSVALPITGVVYVEVEADDEKQAIEAALKADFDESDIDSWQVHEKIVEGNVCFAEHAEASAEDITDE